MHELTTNIVRLQVYLERDGNTALAKYQNFKVHDSSTFYKLTVTSYSGSGLISLLILIILGGNKLGNHNNSPFSTKGADHDSYATSCADSFTGGW